MMDKPEASVAPPGRATDSIDLTQPLTLTEVEQLLSGAVAMELTSGATYLIVVDHAKLSQDQGMQVMRGLERMMVKALLVRCHGPVGEAMRVYQVEAKQPSYLDLTRQE